MKSPKYHLYLSIEEYRLLFHSLVNLKNRLHYEGKYTIRYNKLRKLKIAEKVDTACRSLVE